MLDAAEVIPAAEIIDSAVSGDCHGGRRPDRGRDAHRWAPPAQNRTCGFPAYGSHLGCLTAKRYALSVCVPAPVTRLCGSESGTCFAGPHSPLSPPFAPPAPQRIAPFCSPALSLLCRGPTSRV